MMAVVGVAQAAQGASAAKKGAKAQSKANADLMIYRNAMYQRNVDYQKELAEWQADTYTQTAVSESESLTGQYAAVFDRLDELQDKALDEISQYSIAAQDASATVATSAAEAETTGNSVALARQQYELAEARATHLGFKNVAAQMRQSEREMHAMQAQSQSRINAAMPGPMQPIDPAQAVQQVRSPSMAPYLLQGASSIVGAAAHYQSTQAPVNPGTGTTGAEMGPVYGPPAPYLNTNPIISTGGLG